MRKISIIGVFLILFSCQNEDQDLTFQKNNFEKIMGETYSKGFFPKSPQNCVELNTMFDDYNPDLSYLGDGLFEILFSSNRNSQGHDFDILPFYLYFNYNYEDTSCSFEIREDWYGRFVDSINTEFDEFGPYRFDYNKSSDYQFLMYSNNSSGNFDIKFFFNHDLPGAKDTINFPNDADLLNSEYDDMYPTMDIDQTNMYFCSNRSGDFDIFHIKIPTDTGIYYALKNQADFLPALDTFLSSPFDEKCPFICKNIMVFTSNSDIGYGGFDLYYSIYKNGSWSKPINFGERINTAYDEYRPMIHEMPDSQNDILIFSSNRDGGKGGFDLYFIGITKIDTLTGYNTWYSACGL